LFYGVKQQTTKQQTNNLFKEKKGFLVSLPGILTCPCLFLPFFFFKKKKAMKKGEKG